MSNYEYIIASLPFLTADFKYADGGGFNSVIAEIKRDLDEKDAALVDFLLKGFSDKELTPDFYAEALRSRNRFLREDFRFDLNLRNAKVRYLNAQLGREPDMDVMTGEDPDAAEKVDSILAGEDLVTREKGLDDILWEKVDSLSVFHYFDIEAVLAYIAKLHIVNRWLALDEEVGREQFRRLVQEVRGTFKGVNYTEQ